jgi:hypothetical protein
MSGRSRWRFFQVALYRGLVEISWRTAIGGGTSTPRQAKLPCGLIERNGEEQHRCFSAGTLTEIAERLDALEFALWHVKRAIKRRASDQDA